MCKGKSAGTRARRSVPTGRDRTGHSSHARNTAGVEVAEIREERRHRHRDPPQERCNWMSGRGSPGRGDDGRGARPREPHRCGIQWGVKGFARRMDLGAFCSKAVRELSVSCWAGMAATSLLGGSIMNLRYEWRDGEWAPQSPRAIAREKKS
jgi:hypothetical protein